MRRPTPPARLQTLEVLVGEQTAPSRAQRRQEPVLIEQLAADHIDLRQRPLQRRRSPHPDKSSRTHPQIASTLQAL